MVSVRSLQRGPVTCVSLLGAGASCACGLSDVAGLQVRVLDGLAGDQRSAFESQLAGRNLEQALSRLRHIATLLDSDRPIGLMVSALGKLPTSTAQCANSWWEPSTLVALIWCRTPRFAASGCPR